ncbi:bifunctional diaminohydroxyphosphoribosylaminopyrimidine deaminase/5-amino-6-(5-phosphoribosylamino)uracil reductase RibD [Pseudomonadota bacterium]|nr:bifunctional diaminohydroxyphosphoribosylaminopyrimidine deaminase/5-amino-6-(5-phosphoribosylamino)uracil reductase RibD [Pseudomonadota bacterium]
MKEQEFMAHAIKLAEKGRLRTQPNPMVGCVIVKGSKVIGEGWHKSYGGDHAEVEAIKHCKRKFGAKKARQLLKGSDLYVNLEPCSILKNTPPCVDALIDYGIKKVICGTLDPNPKINGRGVKVLKNAGIDVSVGILEKDCKALNKIFFINQIKSRPYIILKAAQSLDGKIALKNGASSWISNSQSRKDTHVMRAQMKAILVGKNTAVNDNPALTVRLSHKELGLAKSLPMPQPTKIIIGDLKKAADAKKIFANNARVITGSRKSGFVKKNVEHLQYKNKNFLSAFMADLFARDISSVLVEGGQETLNAFIANNLFDELVLYTAPIFLGKKSMSATNLESPLLIKEAARLKLEKLERFDGDIKATYIA